MLKDTVKEYKVEILAAVVTIINGVLIKKNVKQIKEMKRNPKVILFDKQLYSSRDNYKAYNGKLIFVIQRKEN